jgi:excinuclease ABC subunit C
MDIPNIPHFAGCYIYKDSLGAVIYIGKAKDLKKRVSQYFQKKDHDIKTQQLVKNISSVDFITTDNEVEALLLENTLIKKHKPKYNIDLKDSKRYAFIKVTDDKFPKVLTVREREENTYGPFTSGFDRVNIIEVLRRIFKIRTCGKLPKKACLRYHINLCDAPCIGNVSETYYMEQVKKAEMVLKGKTSELIMQLKKDMATASKEEEYEKAITLRNQINALQGLDERQKVERNKKYDEDIINYHVKDNKAYLMLFKIDKGTLASKEEFILNFTDDFFLEFLVRYYSEGSDKEVIIPHEIDVRIIDYLKKQNIRISVPKQGEKKQLLALVEKNIELSFFGDVKKVESLKDALKLTFSPNVIECFDISHLSGTSTVGSMVQFRNGKSDKSNYRRFKIRSYIGNDDFSGISEIVARRYKRLKDEGASFPDLIVIDGGIGQLNAAIESLNMLDVNIPIISLAKQEEEIYLPGRERPIRLEMKDKALLFLREIRDEAHRFAITYNRLLRKKKDLSD